MNGFGTDLINKLPPIFPAKVLEEKSGGCITRRRLADLRRDGKGPAFFKQPGGRHLFYSRDSVKAWLEANANTGAHSG